MVVERDKIRSAITDCLGERGSLTFDEVFACVAGMLGDVRKIEVREILSELVRDGVVSRDPDYERRRMVFRLSRG